MAHGNRTDGIAKLDDAAVTILRDKLQTGNRPRLGDSNGVGPINYMSPRGLACMLSLAHSRVALRRSIAFVANRSCKRQTRLRSDLTTAIECHRRIKMHIIGLTPSVT